MLFSHCRDTGLLFIAIMAVSCNTGPYISMAGQSAKSTTFSDLSKLVLSMCMLIGRLEIFPMLMLFSPSAWRK